MKNACSISKCAWGTALFLAVALSGCASHSDAPRTDSITSLEATTPPPDVQRHLDDQKSQHANPSVAVGNGK